MRLLPERRRHVRILTLKNAAWAAGAFIVLFIAFSAWNELRTPHSSRDRLYQRGVDAPPPKKERAPVETVEEDPVSDQTFSVRAGAHPLAPPPSTPASAPPAAVAEQPPRVTLKETRKRGQRIVITGGTEGVSVNTTPVPDRP